MCALLLYLIPCYKLTKKEESALTDTSDDTSVYFQLYA
jgi:hypothetical protein